MVDCLVDLSLPTKLVVLTRTSVLLLRDEEIRLCLKVCSHFEPSFANYVTSNDFFKSSMTLFLRSTVSVLPLSTTMILRRFSDN